MPFDSASMDLEKAMGRTVAILAQRQSHTPRRRQQQEQQQQQSLHAALTLQCVSAPLERHHVRRVIQFLRQHAHVKELSLFRVDLGTHPDACTTLCHFLQSQQQQQLVTLRLRSCGWNAAQTHQVWQAMAAAATPTTTCCAAAQDHWQHVVFHGTALPTAKDAIVHVLERHAGSLHTLDLSSETFPFGSTQALARGLNVVVGVAAAAASAAATRRRHVLRNLCCNACQLENVDAQPLWQALQQQPYITQLTHLELRGNQLRHASLSALAKLLVIWPNDDDDDDDGELLRPDNPRQGGGGGREDEQQDNQMDATRPPLQQGNRERDAMAGIVNVAVDGAVPESTRLQLLDLTSNLSLFAQQEEESQEEEESTARQNIDMFCQSLQVNVNLQSLYLRNCGVTSYALERIAAALVENTTLQVLDLRQLAIPAHEAFPPVFFPCMAQWKGIQTLELDFALDKTDEAAFLHALQVNTSLISGSFIGLSAASRETTVIAILRRNRWWKRARDLLADNHVALYASPGGVWMHALSRMLSDVTTGGTAAYCTLRERLGGWLETTTVPMNEE